ncbi:hypothetical protein BpHYR1_040571 [Brachionus plicatilis]|uniref:Uncharacterized protein n=1 Tax=Brachionus plicatilis TaxID=10195 RepID=A0A3M7RHI1_BRAPC|nr:hypothetical protein BpHYR1_040571 [Brachionus plicatilis]
MVLARYPAICNLNFFLDSKKQKIKKKNKNALSVFSCSILSDDIATFGQQHYLFLVCQLPRRKSFQALENSDPSKMFPKHENFHLKFYLIEPAERLMLVFVNLSRYSYNFFVRIGIKTRFK